MPIPAPNLNPPFNIVRLSHTELRVTDLAWSRGYYVDTLGLQVTHEDAETIYLRAMEERGHHCMILKKAAQPSVGVLGFKVWSEEDLDKAESWFKARGLPTSWIERPFMGRVLSTRDPFGVPLEFYASAVSNRSGSITSTCSRPMSMKASSSTATSASG
jgi:catechol 2,3-dioxygenase